MWYDLACIFSPTYPNDQQGPSEKLVTKPWLGWCKQIMYNKYEFICPNRNRCYLIFDILFSYLQVELAPQFTGSVRRSLATTKGSMKSSNMSDEWGNEEQSWLLPLKRRLLTSKECQRIKWKVKHLGYFSCQCCHKYYSNCMDSSACLQRAIRDFLDAKATLK